MERHVYNLCTALLACFVALGASACDTHVEGNGDYGEREYVIGTFNQLEVSGDLDVVVEASTEGEAVTIVGDSNLLRYIELEIENGQLEIEVEQGYELDTTMPLVINVPTYSLRAVELSGSSTITVHGLNEEIFDGEISGSGRLNLNGAARRLSVDVSGSGRVDARGLRTENAVVEVSGSGDVFVCAEGSVNKEVSGSGHVSNSCDLEG